TGAYDITFGGETEDYKLYVTTFIVGNVLYDINGLNGTPANTVDGEGISMADGEQLYVSLLSSTGSLIEQVPVNPDGSYEFGDIQVGDYTLVLTTVENGTTPELPES